MKIMIIFLLLLIVVILFITCPIVIELTTTSNLRVYLSIRYALKLLNRTCTKENYRHILNVCSSNNYFTENFCKYCKIHDHMLDMHTLGLMIYDYVQLKELCNKKEKNDD